MLLGVNFTTRLPDVQVASLGTFVTAASSLHPRHSTCHNHCRKVPAPKFVARLGEFEKTTRAFHIHHIRLLEFLHTGRPLQSKESPAL